eukprot:GHVL01029209.1.p1 GENE.GHVL01029209.1~~GHVL01029209.1.p1  ORF type:complete len:770 (+),score=134.04 GHVL01029209.1:245-2554(+)
MAQREIYRISSNHHSFPAAVSAIPPSSPMNPHFFAESPVKQGSPIQITPPGMQPRHPNVVSGQYMQTRSPSPVHFRGAAHPIPHMESERVNRMVNDYESLLRVEKEHFALQNREKDSAITFLQSKIDVLEREMSDLKARRDSSSSKTQLKDQKLEAALKQKDSDLQNVLISRQEERKKLTDEVLAKEHRIAELMAAIDDYRRRHDSIAEKESAMAAASAAASAQHKQQQLELELNQTKNLLFDCKQDNELLKCQVETLTRTVKSSADKPDEIRSVSSSSNDPILVDKLNNLQRERDELSSIILSKDRQLSAMMSVNPNLPEISAVQLGVQAISMVNDSIDFRKKIRNLEIELGNANHELKQLTETSSQLESDLIEKKKVVADLVETIAHKDRELVHADEHSRVLLKERDESAFRLKRDLEKCNETRANLESDVSVKDSQMEELRKELSSRDQRIVSLQAELGKLNALKADLSSKCTQLVHDGRESENALHMLMEQAIMKDQLVNDYEQKLCDSNSKLHSSYMDELMRQKRQAVELKIRDVGNQEAVASRDAHIEALRNRLDEASGTVNAVRRQVFSPPPPPPITPLQTPGSALRLTDIPSTSLPQNQQETSHQSSSQQLPNSYYTSCSALRSTAPNFRKYEVDTNNVASRTTSYGESKSNYRNTLSNNQTTCSNPSNQIPGQRTGDLLTSVARANLLGGNSNSHFNEPKHNMVYRGGALSNGSGVFNVTGEADTEVSVVGFGNLPRVEVRKIPTMRSEVSSQMASRKEG